MLPLHLFARRLFQPVRRQDRWRWPTVEVEVCEVRLLLTPTVRMIYLVPSDRPEQPHYQQTIASAIQDVRQWYGEQMADSRTFHLHAPVVETYRTVHTASWYATNNAAANPNLTFWNNVIGDAFALTGGNFNDPENRWIYYIDADPARGQLGGAGTSGVAVLPANDLRGLTGEPILQINGDEPTGFGVNRWIGGLGHEVGHAFGLPHPAACEDNDPNTVCPDGALMWTGYATYPNAFLLQSDRDALARSPFFTLDGPTTPPADTVLIEDFETSGPFQMNGAARLANGKLQLTDGPSQRSSVWFDQLLTSNRFQASFDFELTRPGGLGWADGFTFAVLDASRNENTALGGLGEGIGYLGLSGFAIEFDTFQNATRSDPAFVHLGVDLNGSVNSSVVSAPLPFDLRNAGTINAEIIFDRGSLSVSLANASGPLNLVLTASLPPGVRPLLGRLGFTGATASGYQTVRIDNFRLSVPRNLNNFNPETGELTLVATGSSSVSVKTSRTNMEVRVNGIVDSSVSGIAAKLVRSVIIEGGDGPNRIDLTGLKKSAFSRSAVASILIKGGDGNDTILGSELNETILGESGNDTIDGRQGADFIDGGWEMIRNSAALEMIPSWETTATTQSTGGQGTTH